MVDKVALGHVLPEFFDFALSISFHIISGTNNRPIGGCSSETWFQPIDRNNNMNKVYLSL
jgi:hypothetical protein